MIDTKAKAANTHCERSTTEPMSLLEQAKVEPRAGVSDWYNRRRESYPASERVKAAGGVALSRQALLKEDRLSALESLVPDEAPIAQGPASIGVPRARRLTRFSGAKVRPAVFTQIYNGESRSLYR